MSGIGNVAGARSDTPATPDTSASMIAVLKGLGVAVGGAAVTPSDTVDLAFVARALWIGGAGDLKLDMANGDTITLVDVPAGTLLPVAVKRVYATGTDAASIVALK